MAVRPRPTQIINDEYLPPRDTSPEVMDAFIKEYGYGQGLLWQSVEECFERAKNKKDVERAKWAKEHFSELYQTDFPTSKEEQQKYRKAALQVAESSMDQLFDFAEQYEYPIKELIKIKRIVPPVEEMVEEERTFFNDNEGTKPISGPSKLRREVDPYQKLMDAINYGISLTSNKNRFFVHTIFEKIPEHLKIVHPRVHTRLITMIPYEFDEKMGNPKTEATLETHATIIISDISSEGIKTMCFTEPNRIMWKQLWYRQVGNKFDSTGEIIKEKTGRRRLKTKKNRELKSLEEYVEEKFNILLNPQNKFLGLFTSNHDILNENLKYLKGFADEAKKYFLDLPVYNDFGPNCTRLCIYIMFYYCFISTRSDELTHFAIKLNDEGKLWSLRRQMKDATRTFDKIKPLLYGLLRAKPDTFEVTADFKEGEEIPFDPSNVKESMEETPQKQRKRRKTEGGGYYRHEHLY